MSVQIVKRIQDRAGRWAAPSSRFVASVSSIVVGSAGVVTSWYDSAISEWSGLGLIGVIYGSYFLFSSPEGTKSSGGTQRGCIEFAEPLGACRTDAKADSLRCREASNPACHRSSSRGKKLVCRANRKSSRPKNLL